MIRLRKPSPAMIVALAALFVALSGSAVAAGVVPLAKRALVADNAKKLSGASLKQITLGIAAATPALISVQTEPWSLNPSAGNDYTLACQGGTKAISGGFDNPVGDAFALDTRPSSDGSSWRLYLQNLSTTANASGTVYAICLA